MESHQVTASHMAIIVTSAVLARPAARPGQMTCQCDPQTWEDQEEKGGSERENGSLLTLCSYSHHLSDPFWALGLTGITY